MAADGGTVTFSGYKGTYGYLVIIKHDNGTQTYYAHNSSLLVKAGEKPKLYIPMSLVDLRIDNSEEVAIDGELISVTAQDAERGNTLLWLDGESLSYTTATLLANGNYQLDGLVRGQYGTLAKAHKANQYVVRCDDALVKPTFLDDDIGKTVYFKFTSFNIFGGNEQSLADVSAFG